MFDITKDAFYTIEEAAEKAKISRQKFNDLRREGNGPRHSLIGGKKVIASTDFNAWVIKMNPHLAQVVQEVDQQTSQNVEQQAQQAAASWGLNWCNRKSKPLRLSTRY